MTWPRVASLIVLMLCCGPYTSFAALNNPHRQHPQKNVRHAAFSEAPKTLDPARAYSSNEIQIIAQIVEPPLEYHYLLRPYQLTPLTATRLPVVTYYNHQGQRIYRYASHQKIAYSVYDIYLKSHVLYQPHPAFVTNDTGHYAYLNLKQQALRHIVNLNSFKRTATVELTANDYVYEIKRLASPKVHSPIFGLMSKYIVGFVAYNQKLQKVLQQHPSGFLDLRQYPMAGVKIMSRYHYQIKIKGIYPQFKYWLAMTFFSPIPWQVDAFYSQPGLIAKNITLNSYPVGSGPYMIEDYNPNSQIVLMRNPNYHHGIYPSHGMPKDKQLGLLKDAGKSLPFINRIIFALDKESIPRWNKFLQGYYDKSGVSSDSFDQAITLDQQGHAILTPTLKKQGIRLQTTVSPAIFYIGFNMLDPIVGGYSEKKRKLRQAIAIILDYEEFIAIFLNGRGIPAQGPIPPGIMGYVSGAPGINPYVYQWFAGQPQRLSLKRAQQLLAEAGYPGGINPKTGKPLILNYDTAATGSADDKARFNWLRKRFALLGIQLNIRATLYNRFQDKVRTGKAQIFSWGWMADYPDPENFLFLLYGPNGKVKHGGENATNYANPAADRLFIEIKNMPNGPARQAKINQLLAIIRRDSPWVWGFHPIDFTLSHQWNRVTKPHAIANNTLKYEKINVAERQQLRDQWNKAIWWPIILVIVILLILLIPMMFSYWRRQHKPAIKITSDHEKEP